VCGDDGCGVSCGDCPSGQSCEDGLCKGTTGEVVDGDATIGLDVTDDDTSTGGKPIRDGGGGSCTVAGVTSAGGLAPALLGLASLVALAVRRRRS
jgi:MYXO-CTERM domain-containing protein